MLFRLFYWICQPRLLLQLLINHDTTCTVVGFYYFHRKGEMGKLIIPFLFLRFLRNGKKRDWLFWVSHQIPVVLCLLFFEPPCVFGGPFPPSSTWFRGYSQICHDRVSSSVPLDIFRAFAFILISVISWIEVAPARVIYSPEAFKFSQSGSYTRSLSCLCSSVL